MLKFTIGFIVGLVVAISAALASSLPTGVIFEAVIVAPCRDAESKDSYRQGLPSGANQLAPLGVVATYLHLSDDSVDLSKVTTGILSEPMHGAVLLHDAKYQLYLYETSTDTNGLSYHGQDTVVFWVQIDRKYYKVVQNLWVDTGDSGHGDVCESIKYPPITFNIAPLDNDALAQTADIVSPSLSMVSLKPKFQCQ